MGEKPKPKIKICGVRTPEIANVAIDAGADMVGLVFAERSVRCVSMAEAQAVAEAVNDRAEVVGLFVDRPMADVHEHLRAVPLSMVQLHGALDPVSLQAARPPRLMKAIAFDAESIEQEIRRWDAFYQRSQQMVGLIIDTPDPREVGGGTGATFDWASLRAVLDRLAPVVPIGLAGGLTPDNVAQAIRIVRPWMVDVSSGVESEPGVKDPDRIRTFCTAALA